MNGKSESGAKFKDTIGRKVHIRIYVLLTIIDGVSHIYLYDDIKYSNDKVQYIGNTIQKNKHGITNLISNKYQEYLTMIYFKKNDDISKKTIIPKIEDYFQNYISNYLQQYVIKYIKI
jgi:hypothetical protein